jgi:enamine deaminase RidA (YjgF/YER057c/UK114 family)
LVAASTNRDGRINSMEVTAVTSIMEKVASLGHVLPVASLPVATYVSAVRSGPLLYLSGQISTNDALPGFLGRLGSEVTTETGRLAAEAAALNLLAQIAVHCDGAVANVTRVVRLGVFIAATPIFMEHSSVADGASDLLVAVFGDAGRHARSAVGVASLPRGVSVEIDAIVELEARA